MKGIRWDYCPEDLVEAVGIAMEVDPGNRSVEPLINVCYEIAGRD